MAIDWSSASTPPPKLSLAGRLAHGLAVALIVVLLLPYLLTPLYAVVPPVSTPMLWRWLTGGRVAWTYTPLDAMAPSLPLTVVVSEDARFCMHRGVDWRGVWTAIEDADDFTEVRGGSTITQQTAKNLFLWGGRSYVRKVLELPLALWIDFVLPKRRILEIYLNIAQWGPNGEFGAEAGARRAFGRSVRHLAPGEAALLAAMLPNPVRRDARRPGPGLRRLAAIYQARAAVAGDLNGCFRARR
jgi:monofunctional biosynthetic peptidoglycan transglycosylase